MTVNVSKLRGGRRVPTPPTDGIPGLARPAVPPPPAGPTPVLSAEKTPPAEPPREKRRKAAAGKPARRAATAKPKGAAKPAAPVLDGRSLRATGRIIQLNLKVTEETKLRFVEMAAEHGMQMAVLFERMVDRFERDGEEFQDE